MKNLISILMICAVAGTISCKNETPETEGTSGDSTATVSPVQPSDAEAITIDPASGMQIQQVAPNQNATPPQGGKTAAGMNPAHGEPGHDCAIPVGAPLGSGGGQPGAPTITSAPPAGAPTITSAPPVNNASPKVATPSGNAAAGTNPAHGEPGHDCALPVGAPLKK